MAYKRDKEKIKGEMKVIKRYMKAGRTTDPASATDKLQGARVVGDNDDSNDIE